MQETWVQFLGWEDPLEKEMATHSNILAWRITMGRGAWQATVHGVTSVGHNLVTKPPPNWEDFLSGAEVKNSPASEGGMGSIFGLGRSHMPQSKKACVLEPIMGK